MRRVLLPLVSLAVAACGEAGARAALNPPVIDTLPGGIVRVHNTGPTAWADTNGWKLVLERTIAPGQGEPGELSEPRDIVADSRGHVFVVDRDPDIAIKEYGPDGAYLQRFARKGSGPGEFENAALMLTRDTLVIHDSRQARTSTFTTGGQFIKVWPTFCCHGRPLLASDAGLVPIPGSIKPDTSADGEAQLFTGAGVVWYALDGTPHDTLLFPPEPEQPFWRMGGKNDFSINTIPYQPGLSGRFGPDGRYYYGYQRDYRILVTRTGHDTLRMFEYAASPVPIADSLRQQAVEGFIREDPRWKGVAKVEDIPTTFPLWSRFTIDGANNVWVLLPGPKGEGDHWQVFTPAGVLLGDVPAPFAETYRTYWTTDRVYQVTENPDTDLPEIRIWRIDRGDG